MYYSTFNLVFFDLQKKKNVRMYAKVLFFRLNYRFLF